MSPIGLGRFLSLVHCAEVMHRVNPSLRDHQVILYGLTSGNFMGRLEVFKAIDYQLRTQIGELHTEAWKPSKVDGFFALTLQTKVVVAKRKGDKGDEKIDKKFDPHGFLKDAISRDRRLKPSPDRINLAKADENSNELFDADPDDFSIGDIVEADIALVYLLNRDNRKFRIKPVLRRMIQLASKSSYVSESKLSWIDLTCLQTDDTPDFDILQASENQKRKVEEIQTPGEDRYRKRARVPGSSAVPMEVFHY